MAVFEVAETEEQRLAKSLLSKANAEFEQMVADHIKSFNRLWSSSDPRAVLLAMGSQAGPAMQLAWSRVQFILSIDPQALTPEQYNPPFTLVYHQDGTVTY